MTLRKVCGAGLAGMSDELLDGLVRVGLAENCRAGTDQRELFIGSELETFLPLLASFDVKLVPFERPDCPVRFCTGIAKARKGDVDGNLWVPTAIPAGGQADCLRNATLSCLGEISERISLFVSAGPDSRIFPKQNDQPQVDCSAILGFSPSQEKEMVNKGNFDLPVDESGRIDWNSLSTRCVTVRQIEAMATAQLPSYAALFGEAKAATKRVPGLASSIGCAVWKELDGARDRALLELVERDAIAQLWYNRLGITFLDVDKTREVLDHPVVDYLENAPRWWGVYRVRTDLPVHVIAAISSEANGLSAAFGSAAAFDLRSACLSAIKEMLQSENALGLMDTAFPKGVDKEAGPGRIPRQLSYARRSSIFRDLPLQEAQPASEAGMHMCYSPGELLGMCRDKGIDIWEFDATHPDLGIPCIKMFSAQLCSWEPRFGKKRLYDGVVDSGLRGFPASEAEFAARPFPF